MTQTKQNLDDEFGQTVNYTPNNFSGTFLVSDGGKYWLMQEAGTVGDAKFYACKTCGANTLVMPDYSVKEYQHEDGCHEN